MFIQRHTKINIIRNAILAWIWKSNISLAWLLFSLLAPLEVKFKNTLNPQMKYAIWFFFKSLLFHFLVYVYSKFWRNHYQWMVSRFDLFIFIVLQTKCLFTYVHFISDPCFPTCTTGPDQTSPPPDRGCIKTDCFDEPLCQE